MRKFLCLAMDINEFGSYSVDSKAETICLGEFTSELEELDR